MVRLGLTNYLSSIKQGADWITNPLDTALAGEQEEWQEDVEPWIHPSSGISKCDRAAVLGFVGYKGTVEAGLRVKMDNGTYMHLRYTEVFRNLPYFVAADVPVEDTNTKLVRGSLDLLIRNPLTGKLVVGELKSINNGGFNRLPKEGTPPENNIALMKAHPRYMIQVLLYMYFLDWNGERGAESGFFLFENKDTQERKLYVIERDDTLMWNSIESSVNALVKVKETGELPEPPYKKTSVNCKSCFKKKLCFALQDGDEDAQEKVNERLIRIRDNQ